MVQDTDSPVPEATPESRRPSLDRRFSVAPMMDWTDRHCRYFLRQISQHTLLYTEMVTTGALIHGDTERFLRFDEAEHPLALQLGGSDPGELARCAKLAEDWGYDEVNLNVGCPSDRVQNNLIGACLMAHPQLVRDCLSAMSDACSLPVTIKHRLGIDDQDSYPQLVDFVGTVAESGCDVFIVHARKAILSGLSPKRNREVPPLMYDRVHQLKRDFPQLSIILNGGLTTPEQWQQHLPDLDGVMVGREAYQNPYVLAAVDSELFGTGAAAPTRLAVAERILPYIEQQMAAGTPFWSITRHMLGLFHGQYGGKQFRRHLSEHGHRAGAGPHTLAEALQFVQRLPRAEAAMAT